MSRIPRPSSLLGVAGCAAAVVLVGATAPQASATPNTYDFLAVCGKGYVQVQTGSVDRNADLKGSHLRGRLSLSYDRSSGTWCAVTFRSSLSQVGTKRRMNVTIDGAGKHAEDPGDYGYYAGPAKIKAPRTACIRVAGIIAPSSKRKGLDPFVGSTTYGCSR
ncbi:hypothetical protein [Patulibacter minatonensis]|uniref:hypothetical protein n=1 Tax=Patulibacter minatonensis TaxID=298163 RepID=UPI000479F774|nr:hypothetical protein [Patulibacter minatonensis]